MVERDEGLYDIEYLKMSIIQLIGSQNEDEYQLLISFIKELIKRPSILNQLLTEESIFEQLL